ncbi:MAG: signal recognition particle protein Srp19 [Candidatus Bathyarchaeota archaeon]|nr:signal recognition particle protein Srp19 [Candidatus Bathyarchaeota archaeon]MCZ2845427.1 signal recognition particle protein Srp19 [Candidatus Bathyarchaeota archaeon]
MKLNGKSIIWPVNLDSNKTIKQGRRIPKSTSIESPKLKELMTATKLLNLKFEVREDAARPNSWWEKTGYIIVEKDKAPKSIVMRQISKKIKTLRMKSNK